jgi:hypothetical protein
MAKSVGSICRVFGKRRHVTVSLSPFVPRPRTPFQWEAQALPEEVLRKINLVRKNLPDDRIKLKWRDPYMSLVEGMLARGTNKSGRSILSAWQAGARFDGWTDRFDFNLWVKCFQAEAIEIPGAVQRRPVGEALPWDYIDGGVSTAFLVEEARRAVAGQLTPDCREGACSGCGACPGPASARPLDGARVPEAVRGAAPENLTQEKFPSGGRSRAFHALMRVRVKYAKADEMRFTSHLDVTRCIQRGLRRARLPVSYSQGFSPHPRMSFGPPLPLGVVGESEYLDISVWRKPDEGWLELLNSGFPTGLKALEARIVPAQGPSLVAFLNAAEYRVLVWECDPQTVLALGDSMRHAFSEAGLLKIEQGLAGGEGHLELLARLKLDGGAPEKIIERVLRQAAKPFKVIRKGLYLEKEGVLYSPFGEVVRG